ncbi:SprA-related family protein [Pseudoalteromonas sp. P1-9]|uniref:putative metalloprotease CJM1_0395 family protein n=1 Tax=Pseudoalteromonas sp. P1-9 TaxID=1710354 RepID=UPI0006D62FC6|nr:putative metalloprotease CJM1_0395 family protein [Pseudoalteromonas sp. P1-9]KPV98039.1 SprA-related family protein [Pseudoalteromonas sp. P1-9]
MNIVTTYPNISLNTANVHTETARRDNQLRDLVTPVKQAEAAAANSRLAADQDKTRQPGSSQIENQDALENKSEDITKVSEKEQEQEQQEQQSKQQEQEKQKQLEQVEAQALSQLKQRDREVKAHEQAHAAVGGQYAGSPSYEYERGSDGNNYAVAGEVPIDISEVPNDPQATIDKMQQVRAAALAPQEPSGADRSIAAEANQKMSEARADLNAELSTFFDKNEESSDTEADDGEAKQANYDFSERRDSEVNQRAERIAKFYQAATSPFERPNLASYA